MKSRWFCFLFAISVIFSIGVFCSAGDDTAELMEQSGILNLEYSSIDTETIEGQKLSASATSGSCGDNAYWVYDGNGNLTITGTGAIMNMRERTEDGLAWDRELWQPWEEFKDDIRKVIIGEGITRVGNSAFQNNFVNLEEVTLPTTLDSIGFCAFHGCTHLSKMTLPPNIRILEYSCFSYHSLSEVIFPKTVQSIGDHAFQVNSLGRNYFHSIQFKGNIPQIGDSTFFNVNATVQYPAFNDTYNEQTMKNYSGRLQWVEGEPDIKASFSDGILTLSGMEDSEMSDFQVNQETDKTTAYWSNYTDQVSEIIIEDSITRIGNYAFYNFSNLTKITIPASIQSIGSSVFEGCGKLNLILLQGNMPQINENAFSGITSTVIYTANNRSYTTSNKLDYGGNIIWTADGPEDVAFGKCGTNISWRLDHEYNLFISGNGTMNSYNNTLCPWNEFKDRIQSISIAEGLTKIGYGAFSDCTGISEITIPETVKIIEANAFQNCVNLNTLHIDGQMTSIGNNAFNNCCVKKLYVTNAAAWLQISFANEFSNPIASTESDVELFFSNSTEPVSTVLVPDSVSVVPQNAFKNCVSLTTVSFSEKVTAISASAFRNCRHLESLTFGSKLQTVGNEAFALCTSLEKISFTGNIPSISDHAFDGVVSNVLYPYRNDSYTSDKIVGYGGTLEWIPLPDTNVNILASGICGDHLNWLLTNTGTLAIRGSGTMDDYTSEAETPWQAYLDSIKSVFISEDGTSNENSITTIGSYAFSGCNVLNSLILPDSLTTIGDYAFCGCTGLMFLILPDSLTTIGDYAFCGCTGLMFLNLPESLTTIGDYAFSDCTGIATLNLHEGIETLGSGAFYHNQSLKTVTLSSAVATVYRYTFDKCDSLTDVYYNGTKNQANSIHIRENNDPFCFAAWHCSDGDMSGIAPTSGKCGNNLSWNLSEDGVLTVTGSGKMFDYERLDTNPFYYKTNAPWAERKNSIKSVFLNYGITSVGNYAFANCNNLTDVTFPNSLLSIGIGSFHFTGLSSLQLNNRLSNIGAEAFDGCPIKGKVVFPGSLAVIETEAFSSCCIEEIVFSNGLTKIGYMAFACNDFLQSVTFPDTLKTIDSYAFHGCLKLTSISIPAGVSYLGEGAFQYCYELNSVSLPGSLTKIPNFAFRNCGVVSISIPEGVREIGDNAFSCEFSSATYLKEVVLPSTIQNISGKAFEKCNLDKVSYNGSYFSWKDVTGGDKVPTKSIEYLQRSEGSCGQNLHWEYDENAKQLIITGSGEITSYLWDKVKNEIQSISLDNRITSICNSAFSGCSRIKSIELPEQLTRIGDNAFSNCSWLRSIRIPGSVEVIGEKAFYECQNLNTLRLSYGITSIGISSFEYCTRLNDIIFPNSLINLGERCFYGCSGLKQVTFPEQLQKIGNYAFYNCSSLSKVVIPSNVNTIGEYAFCNCPLNALSIPAGVSSIGKYAFPGNSGVNTNVKVDLSNGTVQVGDVEYTGEELTPPVSVMLNGIKLEADKDYSVSYFNNIYVGTGSVAVLGIGNYYGYITETFHITHTETVQSLDRTINLVNKNAFYEYTMDQGICTFRTTSFASEDDGKSYFTVSGPGVSSRQYDGSEMILDCSSLANGTWTVKAYAGSQQYQIISQSGGVPVYSPYDPPRYSYQLQGICTITVEHEEIEPIEEAPELQSIVADTIPIDINYYSFLLKVRPVPDNSILTDLTWNSSKPEIMTVSDGVVTIKKPGTSVISASVIGKTVTWSITIDPIDITSTNIAIRKGNLVIGYDHLLLNENDSYRLTEKECLNNNLTIYSLEGKNLFSGKRDLLVDSGNNYVFDIIETEDVQPTCESGGGKKLTLSGNRVYLFETDSALGHSYNRNTCLRCGNSLLSFVLPSALTEIEDEAFADNSIQYIEIPTRVNKIGSKAFAECSELSIVEFKRGSVSIADDAFEDCDKLTIVAPAGGSVQSFANSHGIPFKTAA